MSMLRMACSMHLSQRALLRMLHRCTQRDLRTVRQRIMPYFPQATIVRSTTRRNRAAAHVRLQSIVHNAISMARVIGKPPPSGVAIVVLSVDATSLWIPMARTMYQTAEHLGCIDGGPQPLTMRWCPDSNCTWGNWGLPSCRQPGVSPNNRPRK